MKRYGRKIDQKSRFCYAAPALRRIIPQAVLVELCPRRLDDLPCAGSSCIDECLIAFRSQQRPRVC